MQMTKVVKIGKAPYDVYIGRPKLANTMHWGNPFGLSGDKAAVRVSTRTEAMQRFWGWLEGTGDQKVEPERRRWILDNLEQLRGKRLGCFCMPQPCHGLIYRAWLGEITKEQALSTALWQEVQNDIFGKGTEPIGQPAVVEQPAGAASGSSRKQVDEFDQPDLFG